MASRPDMVSVSGISLLAVHWDIVFIAVLCLSCCMQVDILHPCASLKWRECKRLPVGMLNAQAVWLGDKLYVGGGTTSGSKRYTARLYIYTPSTDTWNHVNTPVYWFSLVTYHSQLVLVGGREYVGEERDAPVTNKLWTLTENDQWRETLPPMTTKCHSASAVEFTDNLLVAGGADDTYRNIDIVEVYNGHHWAKAQCLPKPYRWMKSAVLNGHWYLMGGVTQGMEVYYASSLDSLVASCQSGKKPLPPLWKRLPDVPHERSNTAVFGNRLTAVGGGYPCSSSIHAYSPHTQSWVHVGDMPVGLASTCTAPLQPIPVSRLFQIVGVDVMELPCTEQGNRYVLVFQDFLSKWPLIFPMPDQKSIRIAQILVQEVVPLFGVPEALLSDRGTNLLSHLMQDICTLLGIKKLNTTAHHPECDGMVERFNRTLKTMLRKHASKYGNRWDRYLFGVVWAYRNTPHDSTGEKPSFLLFGTDCRTPSEAALLPPNPMENTSVEDYREEVIQTLSTARRLAADSIQNAQRRYKAAYDKKSSPVSYGLGDWVLVKFPQDETGRNRKLSRPWHGPYRIVERRDPDVTVVKVYAPQEGQIQVHQSRVSPCPPGFPAGFFWYGGKRSSPGRPPKWVDKLLQDANQARDLVQHPPLLVDSDLQQYPPPSCQLETDSSKECAPKAPTNRAEDSVAMEAVLGAEIPARRQTKYGLRTRSKLTAPSRLMFLSSGRAPLEGRVM